MKFKVLVAVALLFNLPAFAQILDLVNTSNIVPPTPEVSALAKFLDMPTGTSSGVPAIGIPLYELKNGSISIPISLNYNAGGVRVEENSSWVGMGWNLSAGGSVSRIVHGIPDDINPYGYMYTPNTVKYIRSLAVQSTEYYNIMYIGTQLKTQDVEPDVFMFNVPGYSGKFYWSQDQKKFIEGHKTGLIIDYFTDTNGSILGFILTTPNGTKYYLGASKDRSRQALDQFKDQQTSVSTTGGASFVDDPAPLGWHYTGWQLMEIVTPENKSVGFTYTSHDATNFGRSASTRELIDMSACQAASNRTRTSYFNQNSIQTTLASIYSDLVTVRFVPSIADREDVAGGKKLDSIVVTDKQGKIIKNYFLDNSVVTTTDPLNPIIPGTGDISSARKRLFLNKLWDLSNNGVAQAPYKFTYYKANELPHKVSASQDLWGFFNGKTNSTLIPYYLPKGLTGADRTVILERAMCGTMTKMEYPTGGATEYTYESNVINAQNLNIAETGFLISGTVNTYYYFYRAEKFRTGPNTFEDTFTIANSVGIGGVKLSGCDKFNTILCPLKITITGITDPTFNIWYKGNSTSPLPAGKYKISCEIDIDKPDADFGVEVTWQALNNPAASLEKRLIAGGLRIKKIVNTDAMGGTLARSFTYNRFDNNDISSGMMKNLPVMAYYVPCGIGDGENGVLSLSSQSAMPGYSNDPVGILYENVTEYQDENALKLKTEYEFSNSWFNFEQPNQSNYPAKTGMAADWRSGLLLAKRVYEDVPGPTKYRMVAREANVYYPFETDGGLVGLRIAPWLTAKTFGISPYNGASEWFVLDHTSSSTFSYDDAGNASEHAITTNYTYDAGNNYFLKTTQTTDSKGRNVLNTLWYPKDYNDVQPGNVSTLLTKGIRNVPMKFESTIGGNLAQGQVLLYNTNGQPVSLYLYENNTPVAPPAHDRNTLVPTGYNLKKVLNYDSYNGNLLSTQENANVVISYLWDYNNSLPIAQVTNADTANIAYTSFEADGNGKWVYTGTVKSDVPAVTGKRYLDLNSGKLARYNLRPEQTYIVTYWTKNTSPLAVSGTVSSVKGRSYKDWNYFEHKVTGVAQVEITGASAIDEVKLFPVNADIITYTYAPGIGVTSISDLRGVIKYFEYDGWNRVAVIRDLDGNIIKAAEYKYQGL